MKLKIYVCTKYVRSKDEREIDTEEDLGIDIEDWEEYEDSDKDEAVFEYIQDQQMFEIGWEEK